MVALEAIINWLTSIGGRPLDAVFIVILYFVRKRDMTEIKLLREKYQLLNTAISNIGWIIRLKLGVKVFKQHRSGDIEIVQAIDGIDKPVVYAINGEG